MRVVLINVCLYGSTGRIVKQIEKTAKSRNIEVWTATAYHRNQRAVYEQNDIIIGGYLSRGLHISLGKRTGKAGLYSRLATKRFISQLKKIKPDIIHLHNLHNAYINLPLLFDYIRENNIKTVWTFHDCWPFTGRCPHFEITGCDKWKTGCSANCPYGKAEYPLSKNPDTRKMWQVKKSCSKGIDLTIVTPSKWLAGLAKESFYGDHKIMVINNGIDLSSFKYRDSDVRARYGIKSKYVVLGVAKDWCYSKGFDVFADLSKALDDSYQIVLVGVKEAERAQMPDNVICIGRTDSQTELAEIYSAADVFVNPTREDTFPTVNIEANACGTPVVTFATGGSPECIDDKSGIVVERNNVEAMREAVVKVCEERPFEASDCVRRAQEFESSASFNKYVDLYEAVIAK